MSETNEQTENNENRNVEFAAPKTRPKHKRKEKPPSNLQSASIASSAPGEYGLWVPPEREFEEKEGEPAKEDKLSNIPNDVKQSAEALEVPLVYEPPFWSAPPKYKYKLELVKDGVSKGYRNVWKKPFYLVGRAPVCDIQLEHPSISRQHAVIQYRKTGEAYLYDLGSAHGSFLGKKKVAPKSYVPIEMGRNVLKFGQSTRIYILVHPEADEPEQTDEQEEDGEETEKDKKKKTEKREERETKRSQKTKMERIKRTQKDDEKTTEKI